MHIQLYDIPTIATAGIAILMAFNFLIRPPAFRSQVLGLLFLCGGHLQFSLYLVHSNNIYKFPHFFFLEIPAFFMIGALQYFFVLSLIEERESWRLSDLLHFIPAILSFFYAIPLIMLDTESKTRNIRRIFSESPELSDHLLPFLAIIVIFIYFVWATVKFIPSLKQHSRNRKRLIWLLLFFSLLLISLTIAGITIIAADFSSMKFISFFISITIIAQFIFTQRYPYLVSYTTIPKTKKEYSKSHLETLDITSLQEQLKYLMKVEKFFCDEDLTLARLSQALEITAHQLSQYLNEHHQKNFNAFINGYRVTEAKKLLLEEPGRNALSIAYASGFNSYSAFFNAFKKQEGLSPAEFRKNHLL